MTFRSRFSPGKGPPVHIVQEAGLAPVPVWTQRPEKKSFSQLLQFFHIFDTRIL